MALDIENEDVEEGTEGAGSQVEDRSTDEPQTKTFDRESYVNDTFAEGIEESVIEELGAKEEITIDDLRKIPGSEGMSDAQLTAAWDKAQKEAGIGEGEGGEQAKVELPFPVYDAQGNKIAPDKVTIADLMSGKALIGYNAMGKEQRKAFAEVVRNASQGHWNEHRYTTVQSQYKETARQVESLRAEAKQFEEQRNTWNSALAALAMGDNSQMKQIVDAYRQGLGRSNVAPEGFVSQDLVREQAEAAERGQQWYTDVGLPAAMDIASRYSADAKEVIGAIKYFIENEPVLTPQRIEEIIKYDVPMAFEAQGYSADGNAPEPEAGIRTGGNTPGNDVAAMQKQIDALTARLAGTENDKTNRVRNKGRNIPPAGAGSTPGAGDSMPAFKSRGDMKEWLQS